MLIGVRPDLTSDIFKNSLPRSIASTAARAEPIPWSAMAIPNMSMQHLPSLLCRLLGRLRIARVFQIRLCCTVLRAVVARPYIQFSFL